MQYRGDDLDAARGPGLGCFWAQLIVLAVLVVLTPVTVSLGWPFEISAFLLFATLGILLLTGQTIIFLLRLVAAERRGRRRPLSSATKTMGELEDGAAATPDGSPATAAAATPDGSPATAAAATPDRRPATAAAATATRATLDPEAPAETGPLDAADPEPGPSVTEPSPPGDVRQ